LTGEMGYPSALTAKTWGFYDVLFKGKPFSLPQPFGSYVMENVLFKISYPAEFHAQTAVEAAMTLHPHVKDRIGDIDRVVIDALRARAQVRENATFTQEYYAADKRYIGNAVQVFFRDGTSTQRVQVDFPIGHSKRRAEGMPVLVKKFETSVQGYFPAKQAER